ncbi:hypothetical protein [Mycobacterium riyadhense]|uniref:Uncharacterized protein n=1 Tax=Mycobacterium riyadhense TaxID=486698 RepID=A0A1X2BZU9_9MYCO|nr:hypothetical protein [Mycobacterium riyadhense]MCV7147386.1 hypothetical protein [Mycobacterium riyadhense]ORW69197.1 hypothetical protein AWC22_25965 [Mycobacterium riyadhense]VTP03320.1 hypothetical protein BIN_B_04980 [Mycobacterium riyadhense]
MRYDSTKPYAELLAALLAAIGERPVLINGFATGLDSWKVYQAEAESHVGPTYVRPSSLMVVESNPELLSTARQQP